MNRYPYTHIVTRDVPMPYMQKRNAEGKRGHALLKIVGIESAKQTIHTVFRENVDGLIRETEMSFTFRFAKECKFQFVEVAPGTSFVNVPLNEAPTFQHCEAPPSTTIHQTHVTLEVL